MLGERGMGEGRCVEEHKGAGGDYLIGRGGFRLDFSSNEVVIVL